MQDAKKMIYHANNVKTCSISVIIFNVLFLAFIIMDFFLYQHLL